MNSENGYIDCDECKQKKVKLYKTEKDAKFKLLNKQVQYFKCENCGYEYSKRI